MLKVCHRRFYIFEALCFAICLILMVLLLFNRQISILNNIQRDKIVATEQFTQKYKIGKDIDILSAVRKITKCGDRSRLQTIEQIGKFTVLYNLVLPKREFLCHESITYSSQGDYSFLDNIVTLLERWQGPLSVALYAPGDDFVPTLDSIAYLRSCESNKVEALVSFHVYYHAEHPPKLETNIVEYIESYNWTWDCSIEPPFETIPPGEKYRIKEKMEFPINVGRNIAIRECQTHFLISADLELYPSINLIPNFLEMIVRDHELFNSIPRKVYVLPVFESAGGDPSPETKSELQELYENHKALFFNEKLCPECHNIPEKQHWLAAKDNGKLAVFLNSSRIGKFKRWEPVYIGTQSEPRFQERVTWDGGSDKMVKDFVLCLLDYKLLLLDNAFIVHRPGFKKPGAQKPQTKRKMTDIILNEIVPELEILYGKRKGCVIGGQFSKNLPNYR